MSFKNNYSQGFSGYRPSEDRVASSFVWSFFEQGGTKAIHLVVQIMLARILAPEAFGVLAILLVVVNIADAIAQSGMGSALVQGEDVNEGSFTTAFWLSVLLALAMYSLVFVSAPAVADFYGMEGMETYLRVIALVLFTNSANGIQRAYLQKELDFKSLFAANTIAALGSGGIALVAAFSGMGVWALVIQTISLSILLCLVMAIRVPWKPSRSFVGSEARALFGYGWKMCASSILMNLYSGISELIIGRVVSVGDLGIYSQGRKYPTVAVGTFSNAIANVMFPVFAKMQGDAAALGATLKKSLLLGTFLVAPTCLLCAVVARPLIVLLLTEKWIQCVPIFQMMFVSYVLLIMDVVNLRAYMAIGRSDVYLKIQIVKVFAGIVVIGGAALLSRDIYITSAATMVFNWLAIVFIESAPSKRLLGYSAVRQLRDQLPILAVSAVSAAAALAVGHAFPTLPDIAMLLAQSAGFALVYLALSRLFQADLLREATSMAAGLLARKRIS